MSFFIRKSLTSGPIRLNISKGGLGLSAGVTGARIGLNKHGAYVAGGRHGLYYRERLKSRRRSGRNRQSGKTVELFRDTGQTYTRPAEPATDEKKKGREEKLRINIWIKIAAAVTLISGILNLSFLMIVVGVILIAGGYIQRERRKKEALKIIDKTREQLESLSENEAPHQLLIGLSKTDLAPPFRTQRDKLIGEAAALLYMDAHPEFGESRLHDLLYELSLNQEQKNELLISAFDELLESCLSDHIISEEEEEMLAEKAKGLRLPADALATQLHQISRFSALRKQLESKSEPVDCPVNLTRGEQCYVKTKARILKKKVVDRFQREGVKYKVSGYDTDLEGDLYLTNKQLYLVHSGGIRNIRLSQIMDITCSMEDDTIHLSLRNRVNPIVIAVEDAVVLSANIQFFLEE